ncbi:hypothetical protein M9458_058180 [Cirrhinus mrigala]|uniref:Uncharacterized protein n=1 Tax=Cirrhinus mrigala TaxID=683832 RepID=A0ABD0MAF6_CIRMR
MEWLRECGLDCVDEALCVFVDVVEGENSCTVIHIHSYCTADGLHRETSQHAVVYE